MAATLVLSVGHDPLLLKTRQQVLAKMGYLARTVTGLTEFCQEFPQSDYDLVILCHTLSASEIKAVVNFVRSTRPSAPVLGLDPGMHSQNSQLCDATCPPDPSLLRACIDNLLGGRKKLNMSAAAAPTFSQKQK